MKRPSRTKLVAALKPFAAIPLCYPRIGSQPQRAKLDVPAPGNAYTAADVEAARRLIAEHRAAVDQSRMRVA